jgi:hypothetical protein
VVRVKFVLLHAPSVGPVTWRWVADALIGAGHDVVVPDLRQAAVSGHAEAVVREAVAACPSDTDALVAHSGAGILLPVIADSVPTPGRPRLVVVDAAIPDCEGHARLNPAVVDLLRPVAVDGVLPPWSVWWGDVEQVIPDEDTRAAVEAESPQLPIALLEDGLPVPAGWCEWECDYLSLSEDMRGEAERARSLGWSDLEDLGNHLDVVNRADVVAADLVQMMT